MVVFPNSADGTLFTAVPDAHHLNFEIPFFLILGPSPLFADNSVPLSVSLSRSGSRSLFHTLRSFFIHWFIAWFAASKTKCLSPICSLHWTWFVPLTVLFFLSSRCITVQLHRERCLKVFLVESVTSDRGLCWPHWVEIWTQSHISLVLHLKLTSLFS